MSYIGTTQLGKMFFGTTEISKAYLGNNLVYQSGSSPTPPAPTINYLTFGSPTIVDGIFSTSSSASEKAFVYTNEVFNPGAGHSWIIQTRVKINTAVAWKDIISTIKQSDGEMEYSIVSETRSDNSNQQYALYLSSNGSSWNLANSECKGSMYTGMWRNFQIVCTYSNGNYVYRQGYPELGSWTSAITKTSPPLYGKYIGFGTSLNMDADFDLSATKIFVDGELWWEAITEKPYDAEVEYLQGDGLSYIDTEINLRTVNVSTYEVMFSQVPSGINVLFGIYYDNSSVGRYQGSYINSGKWSATSNDYMTTSGITANANVVANTRYTITVTQKNAQATDNTIYFFARHNDVGSPLPTAMRAYSLKMYQNGSLVRDFIPVRKGQVGYMYDKISGRLFGNIGSGSFTFGPDK